eukprot:NODE_4968_length_1088_cov_44.465285_g4415_i0.p1 GENE.NODE_4968_length_1088_cov_44.465285_g4415_i0~~NODE_4968_length_1088_cov_44.465285_g4415_i0.p1  ORF type:complete len:302 (+),score=24.87 NODE_4968_length_1088_cov_44.465285_g4415_i0:44-907(+)
MDSTIQTAAYAAMAECLVSCFYPILIIFSNFDLGVLILNIVGAGLEGATSTYQGKSIGKSAQIISCFRGGFLATLTSFSFVAVHSADLAKENVIKGVSYALLTIILSSISYKLSEEVAKNTSSPKLVNFLPQISVITIFTCLILTVVLPSGMVHDIRDPEFAPHRPTYLDTEELLLGIVFAALGAYVGGWISSRSPSGKHIEWATVVSNFVSVCLVLFAFWLFSESRGRYAIVLAKFVGSFCGSSSAFPSTIGDFNQKFQNGFHLDALLNILLNLSLILLVFLKFVF